MVPRRTRKKIIEQSVIQEVKANELVKPEITCDRCFCLISNSQYFSIPPNLSKEKKIIFIKKLISDRNDHSTDLLAVRCKNCSNSDSSKMTLNF